MVMGNTYNAYDDDDQGGGKIIESLHQNHRYTDQELEVLRTYDSFDYHPPDSEVYRKWKVRQEKQREWDRWMIMGMIGFLTGVIGFMLMNITNALLHWKWEVATEMLEHHGIWFSFIACWGISVASVAVGSGLIAIFRPSAASSGMPEIIAFLNGTVVRDIFALTTLFAKFFSCALAVGAGMPAGPEGPMIHMGSLIGAGISQFESKALGFKLPFFGRFRNSEDRRNFISAGAACGIASAFRSPVGGLLFAFEEVSSYWSVKLSLQTFFCCMVASFTACLFSSSFEMFKFVHQFGSFRLEASVLYFVEYHKRINIFALIPALCLGLLGGGLGAIFTLVNLKIVRFRRRIHKRFKKKSAALYFVQVFEPCLIMTIMVVFTVFGTYHGFPCTELKTRIDFECYVQPNKSSLCMKKSGDDLKHLHEQLVTVEYNVQKYHCDHRYECINCHEEEHESHEEEHQFHHDLDFNKIYTYTGEYHQMATLAQSSGHHAITHLFSRNTPFQFDYFPLAIYCVFYFFMACWTAGTFISSGIVVPMLLIGGLYGRIIGRALIDVGKKEILETEGGYWEWVDPGVMAMLGAISFFAGVTRLTMCLAVIMLEMTNDIQLLLLFMVTIISAKLVGDHVTHPLYHALMEIKCIPFLGEETHIHTEGGLGEIDLELYQAAHCMHTPVEMLTIVVDASKVANLLLTSKFGAFPVIYNFTENGTGQFLGTISRTELILLVVSFANDLNEAEIAKKPKSRYLYRPEVKFNQISGLLNRPLKNPAAIRETLECVQKLRNGHMMDLTNYVNTSALSVSTRYSMKRTYILFTSMGLRHLIVTDECNFVRGILTRKDLMGFAIEDRLNEVIKNVKEAMEKEENSFPLDIGTLPPPPPPPPQAPPPRPPQTPPTAPSPQPPTTQPTLDNVDFSEIVKQADANRTNGPGTTPPPAPAGQQETRRRPPPNGSGGGAERKRKKPKAGGRTGRSAVRKKGPPAFERPKKKIEQRDPRRYQR